MAQRYQREIEEILENVNEDDSEEPGQTRKKARPKDDVTLRAAKPSRRSARSFNFGISPGRVFMTAVGLLMAALLFIVIAPWLVSWTGAVAIALVIVAYVMFFMKPRRSTEKRWRGESIEDQPPPNGFQRFWHWITGN